MSLSDTALVTLTQAKAHLRVDAMASQHIYAEYVGIGNAVAVAFDLDNTPVDGSLRLYVDGTLQVETTDFTISAATITFVAAPGDGEAITAAYDTAAADDTFESFDDLLLEKLIEAATKKAEDYTGRAFIQRSITESHFGNGSKVMNIYKQPVDSITSVVRKVSENVGLGDGSTVAFSLDEVPTAASVLLYVDGVLRELTTDYTLDGADITFVAAPADEAKVTAKYTHTILAISEYTEWLSIGRLYAEGVWTVHKIFEVVYVAGYDATRAAVQALIPDAVAAVLLMVAYLYENRTDQLKSESITGLGSVIYDIPSQAKELLAPLKVSWL